MQREAFSLIEMIDGILCVCIVSAIALQVTSFSESLTAGSADSSGRCPARIYSVSLVAGYAFAAGEKQIEGVGQKTVTGMTTQVAEFAETTCLGSPSIITSSQWEAIEFSEMPHSRTLYRSIA